jgi:hypothetical protein
MGGWIVLAGAVVFLAGFLGASNRDQVTWRAQSVDGGAAVLNDAVWGGGLYAAVGSGGAILTSPNGVDWTSRESSASADLFDAAWNGRRFVAVGDGVILSSDDGRVWTYRSNANSGRLTSVAWGAGIFITVGSAPGRSGGLVMTSPDGIFWTDLDISAPEPSAIDFAGGYFFLATDEALLRSADGRSWDVVLSRSSGAMRAVAESNGRFVAVGDDLACISGDGAVWRCQANQNGFSHDVIAARDRFFAASHAVYSSLDGLHWTLSLAEGAVWGLASSKRGLVAVGDRGTIAYGDVLPIFEDGFASGDLVAWSDHEPHCSPTPTPTCCHPTPTPTCATPTSTPACDTPTPTPTPTCSHPTPTPTCDHPTPTPTCVHPTPTPTCIHATPTPTPEGPTPTPTDTPTAVPPTPTPTDTPTPQPPTPTPTDTPTPEPPTPTPTETPVTPTATPTRPPTSTPTPTFILRPEG